jgi:hypothetical protein
VLDHTAGKSCIGSRFVVVLGRAFRLLNSSRRLGHRKDTDIDHWGLFMTDMKLGLSLGYWGSTPPTHHIGMAQKAEALGYDSVWTAEAYGSDAITPLAWIGAQTSTIRLGTGICQISARTPTAMAMAALTMDHLSNGRMILGLGCLWTSRSLRDGTVAHSPNRWHAPESTFPSSNRCWREKSPSQTMALITHCPSAAKAAGDWVNH